MRFLPKILWRPFATKAAILSVFGTAVPSLADDTTDTTAQLRFLSVAIRDRLPTVDEAKRAYQATDKEDELTSLVGQWLASPEHKARVERHFNDMFGVGPYVFLADGATDLVQYPTEPGEAPADLSTNGVWHLPKDVKTSCGTPVQANAWWSDTPIMICPTAVSAAISFGGGSIRCSDPFSANGMRHASCGCGPEQILCYPRHLKKNATVAVAREFAQRARYAYEQDLDWLTVFGGDQFYGDRWLYHHYLYQDKIAWMLQVPSAGELAFLKSLPVDGSRRLATFPTTVRERSGVVTSPAFLRRFNNFRSRVRAITEQLLCRDIDPSLNTSGISTFVNTDLSDFDRAHGTQSGCAGCHYAMDNSGSTLLGWSDMGFYEGWDPKSQAGHVFGEDGNGPQFLMQSYIERGTGFTECMAKRAFEGFSGGSFDDLATDKRAELVALAAQGPRPLIRGLLTSPLLRQLRDGGGHTVSKTVDVTYDFATDIAPILSQSCAGSECHSAGNSRGASSAYVGNEATFKQAPADRIASGSMPPADSGRSLTTEQRNRLLLFLQQ